MIKTFELNNRERSQTIIADKPFSYLYLISYRHNKENINDFSYFTLNWSIKEKRQIISQYFNFYIHSAPLAVHNERKDVIRMLHICQKENISFAEVALKLQKPFLYDTNSIFVTLEFPD